MFAGQLFAGQLFRGGLFRGSLFGASGAVIPPEFILQMETTGADETLTLPMATSVDVDVDWGDGSAIESFTTNSPSHVYATAGTHDIKITGSCGIFGFNNAGDKLKLLAVLNGGTGFTAGSFLTGFWGCTNLATADFKGLNTSATTNIAGMFWDCTNLTTCDVSGFDTANVTRMDRMFESCTSLTTIDVSGFDTANVTNMIAMFRKCTGLTTLDVSGFNTANVTNMSEMFNNCTSLTSLDVSGFNTANVTNMITMFWQCTGLTALDVSGFNTAKVKSMAGMFWDCTNLATLNVSGFDTANVTRMDRMFESCTSLTSDPGIHAFNVTALTNAANMCLGTNNMLSTAEYNTILTNWEAQAVNDNVPAHFGNAKHSGAGSTARAALVLPVIDGGPGWTISDGGAA